jgi:hypothetical protein
MHPVLTSLSRLFSRSLQLYLLVVLADARGFNLRNDVCHGLMAADSFRKELADRVVHCVPYAWPNQKKGTEGDLVAASKPVP